MSVKLYKPTTNGRRFASVDDTSDVTKHNPEKSLVVMLKKHSGRNNQGIITVRHRGGGAKRYYRLVDFKQFNYDAPMNVLAIEYDPNRGARIALVQYPDGTKSYIIAPQKVTVGEVLVSSKQKIEVKPGNRMPLMYIPSGTPIFGLELVVGSGAKLIRGAGLSAQLLTIEGDYAQVRLPSGEVRQFHKLCRATVGEVSNPDYRLIRLGKAGRMRHLGIRPRVRGKVMNPVDHPHGGGEGRNSIGLKHPKTPWGKPALGVKTRDQKKWSNKFILKRRK